MVRHLSFFEALASLDQDSPSWAPTLAGLGVLGLIDAAREDRSMIDADWTGVRAVADSVAALREGHSIRRPLMRVVDELRGAGPSWSKVNESLFAYGRALDLDGNWSLAVDVFDMVADIARAERDPQLAIDATTALGGAARRSGDWDRSAEGYAEAAHLAETLGDKASGLTVRVGTANTQMARGNLPAAQSIFNEVIIEAEKSGLAAVSSLAYHGSASIAHLQRRYSDAVRLAYKALETSTSPTAKDNIMSDLAAALCEMGIHSAARDAYLITSMTSRYQWVRWQANVNLMELAAIDGIEDAFEKYAGELRNAALDPRLRSYFLLYYGEGCLGFGREEEGLKFIAEARDYATANKIYQVAFDAERALATGEKEVRAREAANVWTEAAVPDEITGVVAALGQLREAAFSSLPVDERIQEA